MEELDRPSGVRLPLLLRRKWRDQQLLEASEQVGGLGSNEPTVVSSSDSKLEPQQQQMQVIADLSLRSYPVAGSTEAAEVANRVFTATELEERMWKTTVAMVDIQRQVHRGEETYYEETYAHGNLFRGWDAFIDAKDVGGGSGGAGGTGGSSSSGTPTGSGSGGSSRRVPADARWFSGSCKSVSRNARPTPLTRNLPSSSNQRSTAPPSITVRSETSTPTPTGSASGNIGGSDGGISHSSMSTSMAPTATKKEKMEPTPAQSSRVTSPRSTQQQPVTRETDSKSQQSIRSEVTIAKSAIKEQAISSGTDYAQTINIKQTKSLDKSSAEAKTTKSNTETERDDQDGGTSKSDVVMEEASTNQKGASRQIETPDGKGDEILKQKAGSRMDVPIPKKKESKKSSAAGTDNKKDSTIARKRSDQEKKLSPMEKKRKEAPTTRDEPKEVSEKATVDDKGDDEDPLTRRITRKRKSTDGDE